MNLEDHEFHFRRGIGDLNYPEVYVIGYLNGALMEMAKDLKVVKYFEGQRSWASVAHQEKYAMPATHQRRTMAVRFREDTLSPIDKGLKEGMGESDRWQEMDAARYSIFGGYLEVWPVPSDDAATVSLTAGVTASETTFSVDSVDELPAKGIGIVGSEVFSWTYIDSENLQLTGITRGLEGTVAVLHSEDAVVTVRDITWFGGLLPKKFLTKPERSATVATSANLTGVTDGQHSVYISYFSSKWASESLLQFLDTVTTSDEQIDLSDLPQSEDGDVDYVRVYMTKAGETGKYFVAQVAKGTTSYSITTNDTDLAANSVYGVCESDVEYKWRDVIDDFSIGQWFLDNEQFQKAGMRIGAAKQKMADWGYELEAEQGGSGLFDYER